MKNIISVILSIFVCTGCDKNFKEINIDPTKLTQQNMQYNYLFTSAELYTSGNGDGYAAGNWQSNLSYASTILQQLSSTSAYWYGDKYIYNEGYNAAFWRYQYATSIKSIVDVITNVKNDTARSNLYNISRILKAYLFQQMTDLYGDIPYSDAGLGYLDGAVTPKYDKQQDIYADLLKELDEAAQQLNAGTANTVGNADIYYGGAVEKWKRFAYSEMVRIAMRMSKVAPGMAQQWVQKAVAGGTMQSNDDNALCPHEAKGTSPLSNPVGLQLRSREPASYHLSERFISYLENSNDPRLPYFATVVADATNTDDPGDTNPGIQLGQPNGYDLSAGAKDITNAPNFPGDQNLYSIVNRETFAREDAPSFILTFGATQLLLAEAAQKGWVSGNAADYYNSGVTAAILQLNQTGAGLTEDDANTYLSAHPYHEAQGLEMINTQYWVATFSDWLEGWSNWRRSDYPRLTAVNYQGNATNGTIPRRFTYPLDEANTNPQNYKNAVTGLPGGDEMTSRVWWDEP